MIHETLIRYRCLCSGPEVGILGPALNAAALAALLTSLEPRVAKTLNKTEPNPNSPNYFGMRDDEAAHGEAGRNNHQTTRRDG